MLVHRLSILVIVITAALVSMGRVASADTYYVDGTNGNDNNTGESWEQAVKTIRKGIQKTTTDGDVVEVADGEYTGEDNKDLTWGGKHITVKSYSDSPSACIINCENDGQGFRFENSGQNTSDCIRGFTIKCGGDPYTGVNWEASGIHCLGVGMTVKNCIFENQESHAIFGDRCYSYSIHVDGCEFYDTGRPCTYPDSQIVYGVVLGDSSGWISDCYFTGGYEFGAAIAVGGETATIEDCIIYDNDGHGISISAADVTINRCQIYENERSGVSVDLYDASLEIRNSIIADNGSIGIDCYCDESGRHLDIFNCTIVDNTGGIDVEGGQLDILNCIVWGNGNEIVVADSGYADGHADVNCCFVDESACSGDITFGEHNIYDSGGPGLSGYDLEQCSPCIDAGDPTDPGSYYDGDDYDGDDRLMGCYVDIGADERDTCCFPESYSTYDDWVAMCRPDCWCAYPDGSGYQCDGDADGQTETVLKFRIYGNDLALVTENWKRTIDDPDLNPCADIDHKAETFFKYRVYGNDMAIVVANWKKKDEELNRDCPRPE